MTRWKRRSDRSGRAPLPSPGRPPVAGRNELRRFWAAIASGLSSEDAAASANVPQAVGARWFRKAGGIPPAMFGPSAKPHSGRYLSFAEREEIALLRAQGCTVQEVARRIGRAASTISRELRRNAATRSGGLEYRASTAQWHAERSARRPKQAKLVLNAESAASRHFVALSAARMQEWMASDLSKLDLLVGANRRHPHDRRAGAGGGANTCPNAFKPPLGGYRVGAAVRLHDASCSVSFGEGATP